jgi:hypothetical protein
MDEIAGGALTSFACGRTVWIQPKSMSSIPPPRRATEIPTDPVSVQTLAYGDHTTAGPWSRVGRRLGFLTAVVGGLLALDHALQILGTITGLSDPYLFRINQPGGVGGIPPSQWLAATSAATLLYAAVLSAGGVAWTRRKRWARPTLVCAAVLGILVALTQSTLWTVYNILLPITRSGPVTGAALFEILPRLGPLATEIALPAALILLAARREIW